jgi:hypothetical protein
MINATATALSASSSRRPSLKIRTAALLALYAVWPGKGRRALRLEMFTINPS